MFNFFYKIIIFIVNKEKDDTRSAYCKLSQLGDSANHIAHVIFVLHSAMKTHFQTNQNARTIQICYFITNNEILVYHSLYLLNNALKNFFKNKYFSKSLVLCCTASELNICLVNLFQNFYGWSFCPGISSSFIIVD